MMMIQALLTFSSRKKLPILPILSPLQGMVEQEARGDSPLEHLRQDVQLQQPSERGQADQESLQQRGILPIQLREKKEENLILQWQKCVQVLVFLVLFLYCLITSPLLLIVLATAGGACYIAQLKQVRLKPRKLIHKRNYENIFFSVPGKAVTLLLGTGLFFLVKKQVTLSVFRQVLSKIWQEIVVDWDVLGLIRRDVRSGRNINAFYAQEYARKLGLLRNMHFRPKICLGKCRQFFCIWRKFSFLCQTVNDIHFTPKKVMQICQKTTPKGEICISCT